MPERTEDREANTELARRLGLALWGFLCACFALKLAWLLLDGPADGELPDAGGLALLEIARLVLVTLSLSLIVYAYWIRRVPRVRAEGLAERWYPLFIAVLPFGYFFFRAPPPSPGMAVAGAILCLLGWAVTLWAFAHLRGSFSIMAEVRDLVRGGPYAYVRHPLYLGEMINWIGLAVLYAGAPVAAFTAALISMQALRAGIEERKLQASLGETYADYRRSAGFLWPRRLR